MLINEQTGPIWPSNRDARSVIYGPNQGSPNCTCNYVCLYGPIRPLSVGGTRKKMKTLITDVEKNTSFSVVLCTTSTCMSSSNLRSAPDCPTRRAITWSSLSGARWRPTLAPTRVLRETARTTSKSRPTSHTPTLRRLVVWLRTLTLALLEPCFDFNWQFSLVLTTESMPVSRGTPTKRVERRTHRSLVS